nr:hypothetical protein CFP56_24668 [Quercus suber]
MREYSVGLRILLKGFEAEVAHVKQPHCALWEAWAFLPSSRTSLNLNFDILKGQLSRAAIAIEILQDKSNNSRRGCGLGSTKSASSPRCHDSAIGTWPLQGGGFHSTGRGPLPIGKIESTFKKLSAVGCICAGTSWRPEYQLETLLFSNLAIAMFLRRPTNATATLPQERPKHLRSPVDHTA